VLVLTLKQTNRENGKVMTTSAQAHPVINLPHTPGSVGALSSAERLNNNYLNSNKITDNRYDKSPTHIMWK